MKPLGKSPVKKLHDLTLFLLPIHRYTDITIVYIRRPRKKKIKEGKKGGAMKGRVFSRPSGTELSRVRSSLSPSKCCMEPRVKRTPVRVNCHIALIAERVLRNDSLRRRSNLRNPTAKLTRAWALLSAMMTLNMLHDVATAKILSTPSTIWLPSARIYVITYKITRINSKVYVRIQRNITKFSKKLFK